jgi:4-amino-4-deoxy-L-arabinose transferase-like glycosyltransferase
MATPMSTTDTSRRQVSALFTQLVIFAVAFAVLYVTTYVRVVARGYGVGGLGGVDAIEYDVLARSILAGKGVSASMFGCRPPLFPLFVAAMYALAGKHVHFVVFFQSVFGAVTVVLGYKLARRLIGGRLIALVSAALMAFEVAHVDATVTVMSEPLHNMLLFLALYWVAVFLQTGRWRALLATAVPLCLALLTRAVSTYFAVVLALVIILSKPRRWYYAVVLAALCAVPIVAWSVRNLHYRDNFSMSTSGTFILLFYKAVSVESHATGRDPHEVATDIALEVERRMDNNAITRDEIAEYPVGRVEDRATLSAQREAVSRQMAYERMTAYPAWTAIMTGVALIRQFDANPDVDVPVPLQLAVTGGELALAVVGYRWAWQHRKKLFLLLSHVVIGYYAGTSTLIFAGLYHTRYRTPYMPFILMYSAVGIVALASHVSRRHHAKHVSPS